MPPVMIMSFLRSTMLKKPSASMRGDVAGKQPAIAQHLRGLVGPVPVALHDLRARAPPARQSRRTQPSARPVSWSKIAASVLGSGTPIVPGACAARERDAVGHRAGLGQPVALDQARAGQLFELLLHLARQRRRATDRAFERAQVVAARFGAWLIAMYIVGTPGQHLRLLALDGLQHVVDARSAAAAPSCRRRGC